MQEIKLPLLSIDIQLSEPIEDRFPFNVPVIQGWERLEFESPVTFFVGENGSGKSTVLEALAIAAQMTTVGSASVGQDQTLKAVRELAELVRFSWCKRTRRGFFLRAEDFFGYVKEQNKLRGEMQAGIKRVDVEYEGRSEYAKGLAKMPFAGQLGAMKKRYGEGLDLHSHGESFLALFQSRFVPEGLYLLDEPETPLSPLRQLALLSAIKEMVKQGGQFIIVTHSPILMAFPGAQILDFDQIPPQPVDYQDLEHVKLTRDFLNDPDGFLRHL